MATAEQARREIFNCEVEGIEIADVVFRLDDKYSRGKKHNLTVLDRKKFLNFDAYRNALKLVTWRNRTQQHKPDGTELRTVKKMFSKRAVENLTGEPQQDDDYTFSFSGMGIATETDVDEEIIKYHSPWVMVAAGLDFRVRVPNAPRDFKRLLQYFADLKTGFSMRWFVDKPRAYLLDGVFEVGYDDEDGIFIRGRDQGPQKQLKRRSLYFYESNVWRGKVSDFGNFVSTVENAMNAVNGIPTSLHGNGATWYGLDMMFYETGGSHDYEQPLPEGIIGRIAVVPRREGEEIETRIYSGNEVNLDVEVLKDF